MLKGKKARSSPVFWFFIAIGIIYFFNHQDVNNSINGIFPGAEATDKYDVVTMEFDEPSGGETEEYSCQIIKAQVVYDKIFRLLIGNPSFSEPPPYKDIIITLIPSYSQLYVEYEDRDGSYQKKEGIVIGCFKDIGIYYFDPTRDPSIFMKDDVGSWQLPPYKPIGIEFSSDEYSPFFPLDSETIDLEGIDSTKEITSTSNIDGTSDLFNTNFLSFGTTKYGGIIEEDTTSPVIGQEVTISFYQFEYQGGGSSGGGGGGSLQEID